MGTDLTSTGDVARDGAGEDSAAVTVTGDACPDDFIIARTIAIPKKAPRAATPPKAALCAPSDRAAF
jgi:hypothetical protein